MFDTGLFMRFDTGLLMRFDTGLLMRFDTGLLMAMIELGVDLVQFSEQFLFAGQEQMLLLLLAQSLENGVF
jgi:hypothetical protein